MHAFGQRRSPGPVRVSRSAPLLAALREGLFIWPFGSLSIRSGSFP